MSSHTRTEFFVRVWIGVEIEGDATSAEVAREIENDITKALSIVGISDVAVEVDDEPSSVTRV